MPIVVFMGLAIGLGLILILAAVIIAVRHPDPEKVSAYECGFNAFDAKPSARSVASRNRAKEPTHARMKFDVRFYLVAILFIIFDLEIAFLFALGGGVRRDIHGARRRGRWRSGR